MARVIYTTYPFEKKQKNLETLLVAGKYAIESKKGYCIQDA